MIRGFYASRSGVLGQQDSMNVIANNFANINTNGFKTQHAAFASLIYAKVQGGAGVTVDTGHGVKVQNTATNFSQGGLAETTVPTDMAIIGEGFFAATAGEDGDVYYSRAGDFKYSVDGDTKFLTDAMGGYVLDEGGSPIELAAEEEIRPEQVGVFVFPNRHGLEFVGNNRLVATEVSGEAEAAEGATVKAGFLERSNAEVSYEMVKMIEASKAFAFNARVLQTIDEMEGVGNQLRQ
ncbi:MAG: flagellar hook-basal body protein [Clostridiales Family XIII bacterium]|jgi:flagellar basal-body rod protein FlgG|nr:flagellar hook-basal body protein [Clostridiales Family XIII bacterium]